MSVYGSAFADGVYSPSGSLPNVLGNVQVTVNGQSAPLFYVSLTQINFQAPLNPSAYYPAGTPCLQVNPSTYYPNGCPAAVPAQVVVYRAGVSSTTASVAVQLTAPTVSLYQ